MSRIHQSTVNYKPLSESTRTYHQLHSQPHSLKEISKHIWNDCSHRIQQKMYCWEYSHSIWASVSVISQDVAQCRVPYPQAAYKCAMARSKGGTRGTNQAEVNKICINRHRLASHMTCSISWNWFPGGHTVRKYDHIMTSKHFPHTAGPL